METYYVANSGNNANAGSQAAPWQTLAYALTQAVPGDIILLKRGDVFVVVNIDGKDGTALDKFWIGAYGSGPRPKITGFKTPGAWVNEGGNIWSYTDAGFVKVNMLREDGVTRAKGRWPQTGYYDVQNRIENTQISDSTNLSGAPNFVGGELVAKKNKWIKDVQEITAQTSSTLTTAVGSGYWYQINYGYFVQNHINCLTYAGAWCYDDSTKTVYLYSTTDPSSKNIQISYDQYTLYMNASDFYVFEDITFEGSYEAAAMVRFSNSVTFKNCKIQHHGDEGLRTYVADAVVSDGSTWEDINNNGLNIRDNSNQAIVRKSKIKNIAMIPGASGSGDGQGMGVFMGNNCDEHLYEDNLIDDNGYIGIYFRGNNTIVRRNAARNCCQVKGDGAGLYSFGNFSTPYSNILVSRNICTGTVGNVEGTPSTIGDCAGIYLDDNCVADVKENYCAGNSYGIYLHNNQNCEVKDNYIINNLVVGIRLKDDDVQDDNGGTMRMRNMDITGNQIKCAAGQLAIFCWTIAEYSALDPFLYGIINNQNIDAVESQPFRVYLEGSYDNYYDLAGWQANMGFDVNSTENAIDDSEVIYLVNETEATANYPLTKVYKSWDNIENDTGEITLEPNESVLLFEVEGLYFYTASVSPAGYGTAEASPSPVREDEEVTFTATPAPGKRFVRWTEDGFEFALQNPLTFTPLLITNQSADLVAEFEDIPTYTVGLTTSGNGTATEVSSGPYEEGDPVEVQATPDEGWQFVRWEEDGVEVVGAAANYQYTQPANNRNLEAVFEDVFFSLSVVSSPLSGGSVTGSGDYNEGAIVPLTATPNTDWVFSYWMKDSVVISEDAVYNHTKTADSEVIYAFFELTGTSSEPDPDPQPELDPDPDPTPEPEPEPTPQQPESNSLYFINNLHLTNLFGFIPGQKDGSNLAIRGAWDMPARLGKTHQDWGDQQGIEPYVAASEIRWAGRDINLYGYIWGADKKDGLRRLYSLYDHLATLDTYFLLESELLGAWNVIVRDRIQSSHITQGWYTVDIPFRQPVVYLEDSVPDPADLSNEIGIDGRSFREFGFFLISLDETYDRPKPKSLPLTAWPHEPYRVSPVEHGVIQMEGVFLCDSYAAFKSQLNAFYALLAKPGLRSITIKDEAFRMVFAKDGATVSNVNIEADGRVTAVIKVQFTEGEKPLIDWDYLANEQGDLVLTTEGSKILIVPEGPEIIGYEYLADGFGNLILTPDGDKIIIKTK